MVMPFLLILAAQAAASGAISSPDLLGRDTEATALASATALHRKMDANGDGDVTPTEMARFITKSMNGLAIPGTDTAHPLPPLSAALFQAGDTDKDGRISLAEEIAAAKRAFALQDTNHDGVVTPEERMAFMQKTISDGRTPEGVSLRPSSRAKDAGQAGERWNPPAQATWSGSATPIKIALKAGAAPMSGMATFTVDLTATSDGLAISPFVQVTRGIVFLVRSSTGQFVEPAERMIGSPPPPPLAPGELTSIGGEAPFSVAIHEMTRTIFPGPGIYQVQAMVSLFDPSATPARYAKAISSPVTIKITR
ncbi:EF hand domain-containing protein [Sphingomonas sp. PP-CE-3A-406]|uniref:EF-hand domain-containing protein n=1 Tax=Sphingomonas sp. PP-CE-3A-406 TaxID=2135659 RepID=UPI000EF9C22C|nr:EF-hand domain-containing protein [Sphingomonas sp. PP-CE-3A-406]RMB55841.1 EF hand domain-containing protein [Sphingomonas sp. PP-CE-3A-406]